VGGARAHRVVGERAPRASARGAYTSAPESAGAHASARSLRRLRCIAAPQDPKHKTDVGEKELHKGDNDPIDGVEVGTMQLRSGSVTKVKVLGVLAMIDDGETDWKVLCISVDDPYASRINSVDDLNDIFPNMISTVREWFRVYKTADGKPENKFGFGEKAMDREFAITQIDETHAFWKTLTVNGQKTV
jgi:inorganic pyrophosphatase